MKARTWWLALALVIQVSGAAGYAWLRLGPQGKRGDLASGYVAHVVCSCRYAGGRDLRSCATDFEPGMEIVRMSDDTAAKRVTAWVPGLPKRSARYMGPEYGCTFDDAG